MQVVNTTNTIEIQDGTNNNLILKKVNIASVEAEPFIQRQNFEAPNPANTLAWVTTVKINMNGGMTHSIPLQMVSNQSGWYSSYWTTPSQLQTGLNQAMSDIQGWL